MLTPWNIDCPLNILRGQLKHSWLDNQVLNKSIDAVIYLWQKSGWPAIEKEFPSRIEQVLNLVENLEQGFSPAQLVDRLTPFVGISEELRSSIKQAVHEAYLQNTKIQLLKEPLQKAAVELNQALLLLNKSWSEPLTDDGEQKVRHAWMNFYNRSRYLQKLLEKLPKGVVLP